MGLRSHHKGCRIIELRKDDIAASQDAPDNKGMHYTWAESTHSAKKRTDVTGVAQRPSNLAKAIMATKDATENRGHTNKVLQH